MVVLLGWRWGLPTIWSKPRLTKLVEWVQAHIHSRWVFLLILNVGLLVLGSVLEIYSAIVVLVRSSRRSVWRSMNPVHLGVIFLANLEPVSFVSADGSKPVLSATRFQKPLPHLYRQALLPFLFIMTIGVVHYLDVERVARLLHLLGKGCHVAGLEQPARRSGRYSVV